MVQWKKEGLTHAVCWGIATCLAGLVLIILFRGMVYSDVFHAIEHRRLGTAQRFTQAAPMTIVQQLQTYFRSDGQQLIRHPLFSYRERRHYRDIKERLQHIEMAYTWGRIGLASLALYLVYLTRRTPKRMWAWSAITLRRTALILIGVIGLCGLAALDFDTRFVQLHQLVFDGRDWLLPSYATSIQLFPTQYFRDFFRVYLTLTFAAASLLWVIAWGARWTIQEHLNTMHARERGAL